jgi:hypothetical protein
LEVVRQLFELGVVQSGFWHQFALTAHSPVGQNPDQFRIKIENDKPGSFANNDLLFRDLTGTNHERFSEGLKKSLFNYMHGICFEFPLQDWFDFKVLKTTVAPNYIHQAIDEQAYEPASPSAKIVWLGGISSIHTYTKKKKNNSFEMAEITFSNKKHDLVIQLKQTEGMWLIEQIPALLVNSSKQITFAELEKSFEQYTGDDFVLFWNSPVTKELRENGLLML